MPRLAADDLLLGRYEQWTCSECTATCNFEAMEWCARRQDQSATCGYDKDRPLSRHHASTGLPPDSEGLFEFVTKGPLR